jgi:hypothetical protein
MPLNLQYICFMADILPEVHSLGGVQNSVNPNFYGEKCECQEGVTIVVLPTSPYAEMKCRTLLSVSGKSIWSPATANIEPSGDHWAVIINVDGRRTMLTPSE